MMKKTNFVLIILLILISSLFADEREENIDIFILLDKSLSMEDNIGEVKEYINDYIVDNILIKGDRLLVINFYGKTEKHIDLLVEEDGIKNNIKNSISGVEADGRFTDIGNALDSLTQEAGEENERIRYMLLITDGKQEAPPGTKYYSPDGSFNHEMLKHTKTIQKKGWKVEVLGIGKLNQAADIAEKLSGTYVEVDKADSKELAEQTSGFLSIISIKNIPVVEKLNRKNESVISFSVVSANTTETKEITLKSIKFTSGSTVYEMLEQPFSFYVAPDVENSVEIPVKINASLEPGIMNGTLEFCSSSRENLSPSLFDISIEKKAGINPALLYGLIALLILLIILLLLRKLSKTESSKDNNNIFEIFIDNEKISNMPLNLKNNEKLFLVLSTTGKFSLSSIKSSFAKGYLVRTGNKIDFKILDNKFFPDFKDTIDNIIGRSVNIRMKSGKLLKLLFKRK